jgi:hypothetical protein
MIRPYIIKREVPFSDTRFDIVASLFMDNEVFFFNFIIKFFLLVILNYF